MDSRFPFVDWFRHSSPYVNAHRGKTFVILVEGEAMASSRRSQLLQDLALLHTLGVRVVLVYGIRPQVGAALEAVDHAELLARGREVRVERPSIRREGQPRLRQRQLTHYSLLTTLHYLLLLLTTHDSLLTAY